jgi:hypothetical protein
MARARNERLEAARGLHVDFLGQSLLASDSGRRSAAELRCAGVRGCVMELGHQYACQHVWVLRWEWIRRGYVSCKLCPELRRVWR